MPKLVKNKINKQKMAVASISFGIPQVVGQGKERKVSLATTGMRRNRAATLEKTDLYFHIANGIMPFTVDGNNISISEAARLCQLCYYNFSQFKNVIDVMAEFSSNNIYLRGGSKKSQDFFYALFNKINLARLQNSFFREYYRGGSVFVYRFETNLQPDDIIKLNQTFGGKSQKIKLPSKYVILNPTEILVGGNVSYASGRFFKKLTTYEVQSLRDRSTQESKDLYDSLDPDSKKKIEQSRGMYNVLVPLNPKNVYAIFNNKSEYEPLAIPPFFPVLKDINAKQEMKEIDMAVCRTTQRAVLLMTLGFESKNGEYIFDQNAANTLTSLLQNETVGMALVADFTTKAQWLIPDVASLLAPEKYKILNEDIRFGLTNILVSQDEKFANQSIQVQLFVQRLEEGRKMFITEFLIPEIKRIAKDLGFKNYPVPYFEDIDLKDTAEFDRVVVRMAEIGLLTAGETFKALETGRLPTADESAEAQIEYKNMRDKGFYDPLIGGPKNQDGEPPNGSAGRPPGTTQPKGVNTQRPMKKSHAFSMSKLRENIILASKLVESVEKELKNKHHLKKLNESQRNVAKGVAQIIMANYSSEKWLDAINVTLDKPIDTNSEQSEEIKNVMAIHQVDEYLAGILLASKTEAPK